LRGHIVLNRDNKSSSGKNSFIAVLKTVAPLLHFGWTLAVSVGGFGYVGHLLDIKWSSYPWMTLAGVLLGIFTSFLTFFKIISKISQKNQ
jgi:F0F1-type ATP synthase assembly protein I